MKKFISILLAYTVVFSHNTQAFAQEDSDVPEVKEAPTSEGSSESQMLFKSLEYPELQVVPKASERVFLEAKAENDFGLLVHWPMQVSGLMTMMAGLISGESYSTTDPNPSAHRVEQSHQAAMAATGIGASWIVGSYLLYAMKPYKTSLSAVRKIKGNDKRNELLRERMAEEALQNQAQLIETLRLLSVASNLAASTWVMAQSSEKAAALAAVSMGAALLPLIFPHRHVDAYDKHLEYKRKIYSPISSIQIGTDPDTATLTPQWTLSWSF